MAPQRLTKVVRKGTVNVQCTERTLGGTGELSSEILRVVGRVRAGGLWEDREFNGDPLRNISGRLF